MTCAARREQYFLTKNVEMRMILHAARECSLCGDSFTCQLLHRLVWNYFDGGPNDDEANSSSDLSRCPENRPVQYRTGFDGTVPFDEPNDDESSPIEVSQVSVSGVTSQRTPPSDKIHPLVAVLSRSAISYANGSAEQRTSPTSHEFIRRLLIGLHQNCFAEISCSTHALIRHVYSDTTADPHVDEGQLFALLHSSLGWIAAHRHDAILACAILKCPCSPTLGGVVTRDQLRNLISALLETRRQLSSPMSPPECSTLESESSLIRLFACFEASQSRLLRRSVLWTTRQIAG